GRDPDISIYCIVGAALAKSAVSPKLKKASEISVTVSAENANPATSSTITASRLNITNRVLLMRGVPPVIFTFGYLGFQRLFCLTCGGQPFYALDAHYPVVFNTDTVVVFAHIELPVIVTVLKLLHLRYDGLLPPAAPDTHLLPDRHV